jgi:glucokinase
MKIGIDVGGTKCLGVAVDDSGKVVQQFRLPTPHADKLCDTLLEIVTQLGDATSLGIGVPGLISPEGVIRASPNLVGVKELPLRQILEDRLGKTVLVENDATCAALGEWKLGAARGATDAWVITLGTGIGGGFISGSVLQRGAHGFAGEVGHMVVDPDGPLCPCGRTGCWERFASGNGLSFLANGEKGEDVLLRAKDGAADALGVVDTFAQWVALGLVNLTNMTDPEVIVIGGGVIVSADVVMPRISHWFGKLLYSPQHRAHPRLVAAQLGEQAGAIGAAMLATSV